MIDPELWQIILLSLPAPDLARSQSVCKLFNNLIKSNYFVKKYKYSGFIQKAQKWISQGYITDIRTGTNNTLTSKNCKSMFILGQCIEYNDLVLFNKVLIKAKNTPIVTKYRDPRQHVMWGEPPPLICKNVPFRVNWIELYKKCGKGGHLNCFNFLIKKYKPKQSHLNKCYMGAVNGGHINFMVFLKNNYTIKLDSYEIKYCCKKAAINNNIHIVKMLYHSLDSYDLTSLSRDTQMLDIILNNRNKELLDLFFKNSKLGITNYILKKDYKTILWAIKENIIDFNDKSLNELYHTLHPIILYKLIDNNLIQKECIDWDQYFIDKVKRTYSCPLVNDDIIRMKSLVSNSFDWDIFIALYCNTQKGSDNVHIVVTMLEKEYNFNWKKIVTYLLNNNSSSRVTHYFYKRREQEIELLPKVSKIE